MSDDETRNFWRDREGLAGGPRGWTPEQKRDHPASRPGTGRPVAWRGEVHVISPWMRCGCCGWYQDSFYCGYCACGAQTWINTQPTKLAVKRLEPSRPPALGHADAPRLRIDQYPGCALATVLEGIGRSMTILLVGTAGVGKSTLAAQAGFMIARQLRTSLYWLDADQLRWELIEEAFARAGCPANRLKGRIFPVYKENADGVPDAHAAITSVPKDGVIVVDSLEAWAPRGDKQALALLRMLRAHPARVKLVVAATNAAGGVAGAGELERAGDATVFVERSRIRVGKCRWTIGKTWARRGPAGLDVERLEDGEVADAAARQEADAPARLLEPDFSREMIEQAARWSVREIEAYRARLRAEGVPRESILGWDRAVEEQKAALAAAAEAAESTRTSDEASLSESARAAHARLVRSWPWNESMRASTIAQAIVAPKLADVRAALRELLGKAEDTPLNANEVGNALKLVRDVIVDGMKLTRDLDRKGVAQWRLVACDSP